jgi:dynein heavy chain
LTTHSFGDDDARTHAHALTHSRTQKNYCQKKKKKKNRYKSKASVECPSNPWNIQNHAIFYRLDALLDRCHDVLEIVNIIVNFSVLETATIGGSKGKVLSTSVRQIYADFLVAQNAFRNTECVFFFFSPFCFFGRQRF